MHLAHNFHVTLFTPEASTTSKSLNTFRQVDGGNILSGIYVLEQ